MKMMDANEIISFIQKVKNSCKGIHKGFKRSNIPETVQAFVNKSLVYYLENGLKLRQF